MATLEEARNKVSDTLNKYTDLASGQNTIADVLKQKATEAFNYNKDIVGPLDKATSEYYSAPSVAREKYQDIFNPFTREKLVSQYTGNAALPMLSYANMLNQRGGRIEDIIGAGTNAFKAQTTAAQGASQQAQTEYENLLKEYELNQKYAGTGTNNDILAAVLASMGEGTSGAETTPTEPKPFYSPYEGTGAKSSGGQWYWDGASWKPTAQTAPTTGVGGANSMVKQLLAAGAIQKGDYSTAFKILNDTTAQKVPAVLNNAVKDYNDVASVLQQMQNYITQLSGKTGRFQGSLTGVKALAGLDPTVKTFQDFSKTYAGSFARGVGKQTGVLTDKDIGLALSAMPSIYDTPQELQTKSTRMSEVLKNMKSNIEKQFRLNKVNFSDDYLMSTNNNSTSSDWEVL